MFLICFMVQSVTVHGFAQQVDNQNIDNFNESYVDQEDANLTNEEYQLKSDLEESGGDILLQKDAVDFNRSQLSQEELIDTEKNDSYLKDIGAVTSVEELQKATLERVKGKGKWAYNFIYISKKDKSRKDMTAYRMNEAIKPASTLKIFTGYLAFINQSYPNTSLSIMLHKSDNFMADQALRSVAKIKGYKEIENNGIDELIKGGLYIMKDYYKGLPDSSKFNPVNGSGLNTTGVDKGLELNMVTARMETGLLEKILKDGKYDIYKKLLAQPGQFGTLRNRLLVTNTIGKVYAKTGTLAATKALAGYVESSKGILIFSIIGDELTVPCSRAMEVIDDTVYQHSKYLQDKGLM